MRRINKVILLLFISVILISCGKKSYVFFDYNCNSSDYHKCELKNNKLNCNIETPTCGEYKFKGWYRANEFETPIDLSSTFNKNEVIYARWEKGSIEPSSSQDESSMVTPPGIIDIPSSSSEMPSSSQQPINPPTPVDPPTPEETYTLSFNLNGGTGGQTTPISGVKYNNDLPSINQNKPTKPGYTFMGWYDSQNGGTQYYNSSNSPVRKYDKKGNITLYAHWTINTLSIEYNGNGGSWNSSNSTYGVNGSNTVIVKSTNQVYKQVLNYGAKLESSGLVDYNGSWFKWTRSGYKVESKKEYIIGSTVLDQNKAYSAIELSRYGGCDLSKTNCAITVKVNWKKEDFYKDYGKGEWVYNSNSEELKKYINDSVSFAEYIPERALSSGDSLPLIFFLHGLGEIMYVVKDGNLERKCPSSSCLLNSALVSTVKNWDSTGLKNIPAIIIAPHLKTEGWSKESSVNMIKALISYAKDKYHINEKKVILMGHSHGGYGVPRIFDSAKDKFSALVIMSGTEKGTLYYIKDKETLKKVPMKGYSENNSVGAKEKEFFDALGRVNDLTLFDNTKHSETPQKALIEDLNGDHISDLIYWAISQTK